MTTPFDFESLTLDEVETIEMITGSSIDQIMDKGQPKGKALKAIVFIMTRRTDPTFTLEQAGKLTMAEIDTLLAVDNPKE